MERFVRSQNVKRYTRLLERVTEESDRQPLIKARSFCLELR